MAEKPRLLWHSNAPWAGTGYGTQTGLFAVRLRDHFNLTISAFYGLEGNIVPWNKIPVLPGIANTYGNETIAEHAKVVFGDDLRSGLIVTLMDVWVLDPAVWSQFNVASWVPVDHEPAPEPVRRFFELSGAIPIAMSRFGAEQLADLDPLYVPHAVDTKVYRPIPTEEAREAIGIDTDRFVVGMVAANKGNPSRKCFQEAFEAFAHFRKRHDDALLYLHTEATGRFQGVGLHGLAKACGVPEDAIAFCDQYRAVHFPFPDETMAHVFSSMDVLLSPSAGEGFGIPVIQAQACGVPVIVSDFSAQPELCGSGWRIEGTRQYTPIASWQFRPDVADIVEALNLAYVHGRKSAYTESAREKALEYDVDHVFETHMLPALNAVQQRFEERLAPQVA